MRMAVHGQVGAGLATRGNRGGPCRDLREDSDGRLYAKGVLAQHCLADAVGLLRAEELAWESSPRELVVLYADAPADRRSWRYAVIGANRASVTELEAALRNVMKPEVILG